MAEIEQRESGDEGRAREWMARAMRAPRDPAWTADGIVSDRWMPVSPVSGRLDAFQWKVPLAEIAAERRDIDQQAIDQPVIESTGLSAVAPRSGPSVPLPPRSGGEGSGWGVPASRQARATPNPNQPPQRHAPKSPRRNLLCPAKRSEAGPPAPAAALPSPPPVPRAEPVIPLLQVPDDPGPDPQPDLEPEPGAAGVPRGLRLF